jgi:hypothetical protein
MYRTLAPAAQEILFNLYLVDREFGWKDYKNRFGGDQSKQFLLRNFKQLETIKLMNVRETKGGQKLFTFKKVKIDI